MVDDFQEFWLDTRMTGAEVTQSNNLNTSRAYCYVSLGRRSFATAWPGTDGFYAPNICR
jgi:hypothetical protein